MNIHDDNHNAKGNGNGNGNGNNHNTKSNDPAYKSCQTELAWSASVGCVHKPFLFATIRLPDAVSKKELFWPMRLQRQVSIFLLLFFNNLLARYSLVNGESRLSLPAATADD